MPRETKGARLWLEPERRGKDGKLINKESWAIRDGDAKHRLGLPKDARGEAEKRLGEYIAEKYTPAKHGSKDPEHIPLADVLHLYVTAKRGEVSRPDAFDSRLRFLIEFWGEKRLAEVDGESCRAYVETRTGTAWKHAKPEISGKAARVVSDASARRELEDLSAAIRYHRKEGRCDKIVEVWLPPKSKSKTDFLTRPEAAKLLWAAWRAREQYKGEPTERRTGKHVARFILIGLYTGTRHDAICGASIVPGKDLGWIDVENGVYHRLRDGRKVTKKRQPTVALPRRLLAHLERWKRLGIVTGRIVEWEGEGVSRVNKGFAQAVERAGLRTTITPHTLRHTCATWLMQRGVDLWDAAGYLGMTPVMLQQVYGHHHPSFQTKARSFFDGPTGGKK